MRLARDTGIAILLVLALTEVLAALGFVVGIPVTPIWLPLAFAIAFAVLVAIQGRWRRPLWRRSGEAAKGDEVAPAGYALVMTALAFVVAIVFSAAILDVSYDGQTYHPSAILALARGWNPLTRPLEYADTVHFRWINHYAKGPWLVGAVLFRLTNDLEAAKANGALVHLAALLLAVSLAVELLPSRRRLAIALGVLAAANPVAVCQTLNLYVDAQLGSLILCLVVLAADIVLPEPVEGSQRPASGIVPGFAAALVLLTNVKFTGLVYAALFAGLPVAGLLLRKRLRDAGRLTIVAAAAGAVAIFLVGYNPYVTNAVRHGHPFFPLAGKDAINIVADQIGTPFVEKNRAEKLVLSLFATPTNDYRTQAVTLKPPFVVHGFELREYGGPDERIAGFGPWFSGAFVVALAALAFAFARRSPWRPGLALFVGWLLLSIAVNPESWWARYAPQLWLLPLMAALALALDDHDRRAAWGAWALAFVLTVDVLMVGRGQVGHVYKQIRSLNAQLAELATWPRPVRVNFDAFESNRLRLERRGIAVEAVPAAQCVPAMQLTYSKATVCR